MTSPHKLLYPGGTSQVTRSELEGLKRNLAQFVFSTSGKLANAGSTGSLALVRPVLFKGGASTYLSSASIIADVVPGTGESMVLTVERFRGGVGTSLFNSNPTVNVTNNGTAGLEVDLTSSLDLAVALAVGDYIRCSFAYTAGGAPAPVNHVILRMQPGSL